MGDHHDVFLNCEILDNNSWEIFSDVRSMQMLMKSLQFAVDSSGDTTETMTDLTTASTNTSLTAVITTDLISVISNTTDNAYHSTGNVVFSSDLTTAPYYNSTNSVLTTVSHTQTTTSLLSNQYPNCTDSSEVLWLNGTCISNIVAQSLAVSSIRNNKTNTTGKLEALLLYFDIADALTVDSNSSEYLTPEEVNQIIEGIDDTIEINTAKGLIVSLPKNYNNDTVLGGSKPTTGLQGIITNSNVSAINKETISMAAIIHEESIKQVTFINLFIPQKSKPFTNIKNSTNPTVVAPTLTMSAKTINNSSPIKVKLYFQVIVNDTDQSDNDQYRCSYFNTNISQWDASNCTEPVYNFTYRRFECVCNHLKTFALILLPKVPPTKHLTSQDIASLTFQSISILCFVAVIIHSLINRMIQLTIPINARQTLPLISFASTTILFIFFIALSMTVYARTSSQNEIKCFRSSSILMFFVYFLLIFMFCTKTSIGYFNYIRFVQLFPEPSHRKLFILLIISFFIAILYTSFAVGFNSNPSYNITQLHNNKLCWFTRDVIHYFMTIPISLFLLLNVIILVFVVKRMIEHVRNATSPHHSYERMKQLIIILLSSSVLQGIGWLFGAVLLFSHSASMTTNNILSWLFIICNGLEGVWTMLLYIIIRLQHSDEPKRIIESKKYSKESTTSLVRHKPH